MSCVVLYSYLYCYRSNLVHFCVVIISAGGSRLAVVWMYSEMKEINNSRVKTVVWEHTEAVKDGYSLLLVFIMHS